MNFITVLSVLSLCFIFWMLKQIKLNRPMPKIDGWTALTRDLSPWETTVCFPLHLMVRDGVLYRYDGHLNSVKDTQDMLRSSQVK